MMTKHAIHTIDLEFQGIPQAIGAYLVLHAAGGALVECGPGSTIPAVKRALEEHKFTPANITDVFLTHIHLDHAGSAGWWARQGARVHVHQFGALHMLDPEKLLASAGRIYGDLMEPLWGEFLPVPEDRLNILRDGDEVAFGGRAIRALDTPGHAKHHLAYILEGVCFSGDVGGVRLPGIRAVRLPTVPPEFHLETWRQTIQRLRKEEIHSIAPTHFGIHPDAGWHLKTVEDNLNAIEAWMEEAMADDPTREELRDRFSNWMRQRALEAGIPPDLAEAYETAISSDMSADGIYRYWQKFRNG